MTIRKFLALSAAAMLLPLATPALAETIRVGATVTDPQGGTVGTITAVDGANLMLRTDRHEVRLPVASFTATDTTVLFGMTQADLNTAVDRAQAEAQAATQAAFAVGTILRDSAGVVVGPVTALDASTVTIAIDANVVRVPRAALAAGQGGLVIGATRAQLQAASVPAPPPQPAPAPAPAPAQ